MAMGALTECRKLFFDGLCFRCLNRGSATDLRIAVGVGWREVEWIEGFCKCVFLDLTLRSLHLEILHSDDMAFIFFDVCHQQRARAKLSLTSSAGDGGGISMMLLQSVTYLWNDFQGTYSCEVTVSTTSTFELITLAIAGFKHPCRNFILPRRRLGSRLLHC